MASCPECGVTLVKKDECTICGWEKSGKRRVAQSTCAYTDGTDRCPLPGTISDNIRGGGPYYCRWHWRDKKGRAAREILDDALRNPKAPAKHWADEMVDEKLADRKP